MASLILKGLSRQTSILTRSNSLSRVLHSSKNYNSSQSFHLTTNLPDLKHLTLNELSFKQFSTNSEITNLEKKYNEITKRGTTNAYLIYINQNRKIFAEKNPGMTMINLSKELAKSWRELTLDEKMKYIEIAKIKKKEQHESLEKLFANIQIEEAKAFRSEVKKKRAERRKYLSHLRIRREKITLKRPKAPTTSFGLYVKTLDRGDASIVDFIRGASLKWKAMAEQDKEVFIKEAKANRDEFELKLKEWEAKMVAEGHVKLVRKSFRKKIEKIESASLVEQNKKISRAKKNITKSREKAKKLALKAKAAHKQALKARSFLVLKTAKAKSKLNNVLDKIKSELILKNSQPKRKIAKSKRKEKAMANETANNSADSSSSSSESDSEKPKPSKKVE